ncbi:hypothetical protein MBLNU230_g0306t1 [Neophaeotheca triangularis]
MLPALRPLLRPLPLLGLSTSGLLLAATLNRASSAQHSTMSNATAQTSWSITPYTPRHEKWPYSPSDFSRQDPSSDDSFYSSPRFVTHIDDAAIASLREYYHANLPRKGRILDFCSSWVSHYPPEVERAAESGELQVMGMGMNKKELDANEVLNSGRMLVDLNVKANVAAALEEAGVELEEGGLDASTCVVSIDYLTKPVEVLSSLREATRQGGSVHLAISNRCFPTKAVGRWLRVEEEERLAMVGDYLWFAGWRGIEIVELSNGKISEEEKERGQAQGGLQGFMSMMGMASRDPIWVVRAVKE